MMPGMHARMQGVDDDALQREMLATALLLAVPLWIEEMRPLTLEQRAARALDASQIISMGEKCDELRGRHGAGPALLTNGMLATGSHEGGPGVVFNATAMGLALAAFLPGGITYLGTHWEAT